MTFTTLTYNGIEKSLADWGFSSAALEWNNQASETFAGDIASLGATSADPFPFGAYIVLQIGRSMAQASFDGAGDPVTTAATKYVGGKIRFKGYRKHTVRVASPAVEALKYKFVNAWEFFLEWTTFRQLWLTYAGQKDSHGNPIQTTDYRDNVVLGFSPQLLTGPNDQVPNSVATNLMTITQTIKQIIAYGAARSVTASQLQPTPGWPAGPQLQSDALTVDANGNYYLIANPQTSGSAILIPDYVPGTAPGANGTSLVPNGTMLRAPLDSAVNVTCAECIRRMCRWVGALGEPVLWWDYTTSPPTLHISTVDKLPSKSLPFASGQVGMTIQRRDDLIPTAVAYRYNITGTINGQTYTQVIHDVAATIGGAPSEGAGLVSALGPIADILASGQNSNPYDAGTQAMYQNAELCPGVQTGTFDFQGASSQQATATVSCQSLSAGGVGVSFDPATGGAALAFWTELFPELARAAPGTLAFAQSGAVPPFLTYNGATYPVTIGTDGFTVTIGGIVYAYRFLDGTIAPWMNVGSAPVMPASVLEVALTAFFTYTEQSTPAAGGTAIKGQTIPKKELNSTIKITNIASGTYNSMPITIAGEPIPIGLAGFIYGIASIPKYDGSFTLQETEVTDACPPGNNLNITGGLPEWATMNATPQSISYDFNAGTTRFNFGVPKHLGGGNIVERLRVNHGPRWVNLISSNMLNTPGTGSGTTLGQNVPKQSASPGPALPQTGAWPSNVPDAETANGGAGYPGGAYPGVHHDAAPAGQGNQPTAAYGQGPSLFIVEGTAGTQGNFIRLSVADMDGLIAALQSANPGFSPNPSKFGIFLRCVPGCQVRGGVTSNGFYLMPSSPFFALPNAPAPDPNNTLNT